MNEIKYNCEEMVMFVGNYCKRIITPFQIISNAPSLNLNRVQNQVR